LVLVKAYWLYGVLGGLLLSLPLEMLNYYSGVPGYPENGTMANFTIILLYIVFCYVYVIFISVAIWRSAKKYRGPIYWAILAKGMVILGITATVLQTAIGVMLI
jgi:hypothetical protein